VDGQLTDGDEPTIVRLSISSAINREVLIPVSDGNLYITNENQEEIPLTETEAGIYQVLNSSFFGQAGKTYQLHISLPDGQKYISDICRLPMPSPIDSLYGIEESTEFGNSTHDFPGIQFYIDNHTDVADTSYYLWQLTQTYKFRSSFDIEFTWEGHYVPYPDPDSLRTCWRTTQVKDIFLTSTKYLDPPAISQFPLHFVSTETKMLSMRYSLFVKQLTISEKAFDFYDAIEQQNIDQGNLWSQQPIQILGNIRNVNNPDEPVLGYFIVAGVEEKRIFVDRPLLTFYYNECTPDFESVQYIAFEPQQKWPIYIDDIMYLGYAMAQSKACFDCRLDGGSLTPPDFWE